MGLLVVKGEEAVFSKVAFFHAPTVRVLFLGHLKHRAAKERSP
jgi:hypothetical protein